jgi:hypothetical protein
MNIFANIENEPTKKINTLPQEGGQREKERASKINLEIVTRIAEAKWFDDFFEAVAEIDMIEGSDGKTYTGQEVVDQMTLALKQEVTDSTMPVYQPPQAYGIRAKWLDLIAKLEKQRKEKAA